MDCNLTNEQRVSGMRCRSWDCQSCKSHALPFYIHSGGYEKYEKPLEFSMGCLVSVSACPVCGEKNGCNHTKVITDLKYTHVSFDSIEFVEHDPADMDQAMIEKFKKLE